MMGEFVKHEKNRHKPVTVSYSYYIFQYFVTSFQLSGKPMYSNLEEIEKKSETVL